MAKTMISVVYIVTDDGDIIKDTVCEEIKECDDVVVICCILSIDSRDIMVCTLIVV